MAIVAAIALARALRDEEPVSAAFAHYQQELTRTRRIVERSWSFGQMCLWEAHSAVWLRELMPRWTPTSVMRKVMRAQLLENVGRL